MTLPATSYQGPVPLTGGLEAEIEDDTHLVGSKAQAIRIGRIRLLTVALVFAVSFSVLAGRLIELTVIREPGQSLASTAAAPTKSTAGRADIVDRNGILLATNLLTASLKKKLCPVRV